MAGSEARGEGEPAKQSRAAKRRQADIDVWLDRWVAQYRKPVADGIKRAEDQRQGGLVKGELKCQPVTSSWGIDGRTLY
jgi:hypothetical protein